MATKPTSTPRWALTAAGADASNITTPLSGEQDTGWNNGQTVVSSGKMNFLFNLLAKWVLYLKDAVFVADTGSNLAGVSAQGDTSRGALHLVPQAAPSAPTDGDVWIETTSNTLKARINGATTNLMPSPSAMFFSGTSSNPAGGTFKHIPGNNGAGSGAQLMTVMPACTLSNLRFSFSTGADQLTAGTISLTVFKNGVATALTCTIGASTASISDTTHSVAFAAGDTFWLAMSGSPTGGGYWGASIEMHP